MENDSLGFLPFLFLCLLQEEDTDPGDHEGHSARVNGERNIDREQLSAENRGNHATSKNRNKRGSQIRPTHPF